jgi:hypothetical protein
MSLDGGRGGSIQDGGGPIDEPEEARPGEKQGASPDLSLKAVDYSKPWSADQRYEVLRWGTDWKTLKNVIKNRFPKKTWHIVLLAPKSTLPDLDKIFMRHKNAGGKWEGHLYRILCPDGEDSGLLASILNREGLDFTLSTNAREAFELDTAPFAPVYLFHFGKDVSDEETVRLARESVIKVIDLSR